MKYFIFIFLLFGVLATKNFKIVNTFPHDFNCFTQGFQFINSTTLLQTCGLYNKSKIQYLNLNSQGKLFENVRQTKLPEYVFGQGCTKYNDDIFVLTWRQSTVFRMNQDFQILNNIFWNKEGWGLTHDEENLYVSDGSDIIYVVNQNFQILRSISVTQSNGNIVESINELQFYEGKILANVWKQRRIVLINLQTGIIQQQFNTDELYKAEQEAGLVITNNNVINGIAYDDENKKLLLTGKEWKQIYEVIIE